MSLCQQMSLCARTVLVCAIYLLNFTLQRQSDHATEHEAEERTTAEHVPCRRRCRLDSPDPERLVTPDKTVILYWHKAHETNVRAGYNGNGPTSATL